MDKHSENNTQTEDICVTCMHEECTCAATVTVVVCYMCERYVGRGIIRICHYCRGQYCTNCSPMHPLLSITCRQCHRISLRFCALPCRLIFEENTLSISEDAVNRCTCMYETFVGRKLVDKLKD